MPQVLVRNKSSNTPLTIQAELCNTFFSRFMGLMFRKGLEPNTGIVIDEIRDSRIDTSIHMLFMRFDIAVIWINSAMRVVDRRIARKWQPWLAPTAPARYVLETLPSLLRTFTVGDLIEFIHD